jgi:DNA helicase-2/ATP-dependent DNA helicase PcrA
MPKPKQIPKTIQPKFKPSSKFKKLESSSDTRKTNLFDSTITVGNFVEHQRFGKGEVISLEGIGANKKAEITFANHGTKKLLLQFAKLKILG